MKKRGRSLLDPNFRQSSSADVTAFWVSQNDVTALLLYRLQFRHVLRNERQGQVGEQRWTKRESYGGVN